ncbi:Spy/CpxP family protein refolding chaperone [Myxococcota bacterium]|nr:Spy/CpxP family protein refolding chaperone [Myxococcota bacterium]
MALCLSALVTIEASGRSHRPEHKGAGAFPNRLLEEVGVTESVRNEIASISEQSESRARSLHDEIHEARKSLRDLLEENSPNQEVIMQKVDEIGALEIQADKHRLETMLSIRALLTPEQRIALEELHENHRGKRHGRKMRKLKRACSDALTGVCSGDLEDREKIQCLHEQHADTSDSCKLALRKLRSPEHPRLGIEPKIPADSSVNES